MSRPDGLIQLPNGECIFYDDAKHAYYKAVPEAADFEGNVMGWRRSKRLTGASTLSKPYSFDSGRLLSWKERMTCEGVAKLYAKNPVLLVNGKATSLRWLETADGIREKLHSVGLTADDARDRKATIGTNVHTVLEGLAGVCPMPNVDDLPEEEKGYARAVLRWWETRRPEVLNAEQFVYSAEHGYAGRFDLRCRFGVGQSGEVSLPALIDLKTSSWIAPSHHVQLRLYDIAARECGVGASDELLILKVTAEGKFYEIPCRATEEDAIHAIAVYRGASRIERESGLPRAA